MSEQLGIHNQPISYSMSQKSYLEVLKKNKIDAIKNLEKDIERIDIELGARNETI